MTTKDMILKRCRAAHAVIADIEFFVNQYLNDPQDTKKNKGKTLSHPDENAPSCSPNAGGDNEAFKFEKDVTGGFTSKFATISKSNNDSECEKDLHHAVQADLFGDNSLIPKYKPHMHSLMKIRANTQKSAHKAGTPRINRRQAFANFREIAKSREILDLADVNRIFGYNPSTSGVFIHHAVKRGDLPTVMYGTKQKFLSRDVKSFIKSWFDSAESQP